MEFPKRYDASSCEQHWQDRWSESQIYHYNPNDTRPIYSIDTPPPTVSGKLHMGHVYSYTQAEAMVRFWRMRGYSIYYPFGFDDNGLPTERFVEKKLGKSARDLGRSAFIEACLKLAQEEEDNFERLWRSLGFGVDWSLRYSSIDSPARKISQWSFIDLYNKGRIYRATQPNPWCPECQTAVAQAEMDDVERETTFWTLAFQGFAKESDQAITLPIATTRPELLPACVAVFVHPDDARYSALIGGQAALPLFGRRVPILADQHVDPAKGSGAVMCCTFGDQTDVEWWRSYKLPLIGLLRRDGSLGPEGGPYAELSLTEARKRLLADLQAADLLLGSRRSQQSVRVHERCGTPLELLETSQWFVKLLDLKEELLELGRQITWHPAHMRTRYEHWVQNLGWDWAISRQRYFGVPFPAWHCRQCGAVLLAELSQLPCDPLRDPPPSPCKQCGSSDLEPDQDVMDTWATSSLSPQIAGKFFEDPERYQRLFPMSLRPQAHDIIRTWAFYTIAKSYLHFGSIPWREVLISGHGLSASGEKVSKSKLNAASDPAQVIQRYGADAVRYWACSGSTGSDQIISEDGIRDGQRLLNKLWSAASFIARFRDQPFASIEQLPETATPLDRAMAQRCDRLVAAATAAFEQYEYARAKALTERFFWSDLCDNYLELVKSRLYDAPEESRQAALATLGYCFERVLKLFAPFLPHISEELYQRLFVGDGFRSIHTSAWPHASQQAEDPASDMVWEAALTLLEGVRRFKSSQHLSLGKPLQRLHIATSDATLRDLLAASESELKSASRAETISFAAQAEPDWQELAAGLWLAVEL